ncbi:hypothetical protein Taro_042036 [Colocasia esculenta]|uniref:Uncharacterized protein n=1 Tax=Colocasia esculenta TaxID=4460 RepID=A0A843WRL8_COLES|nr:hypothetical protein [Colocasia esculenta]
MNLSSFYSPDSIRPDKGRSVAIRRDPPLVLRSHPRTPYFVGFGHPGKHARVLPLPPAPAASSSTAAGLLHRRQPPPQPALDLHASEREALSPPIDVDELFDEEHPLNTWVETRQERDVPKFDPRDCSWAEGELDGVEARDPELRVSEDPPLFPQP